MIGNLTERACVTKLMAPPYDVNNPPNTWIEVFDSYRVSVPKHKSTNTQSNMGGAQYVSEYTVQGHYTREIKPGMRLTIEDKTYQINSAYDPYGSRTVLEMELACR